MSKLCPLALLVMPVLCPAQTTDGKISFDAKPKIVTRYPSMEPVTVIDLPLGTTPGLAGATLRDAVTAQIKKGWDCKKTSSYKVSVTEGTKTSDDPITFVNVVGQEGESPCNGDNLNLVQLTLQIPLNDQQKLEVILRNLPDKTADIRSKQVAGPKAGAKVGFTATPQSAVGETLTNKTKRDTGQMNVAFSDTDFVHNLPVDLYVKSTDLFSTDEKDSKSAFSGVVGFNRGLFGNWYSPFHLEGGMQGNQDAASLSAVVNAGVTTLVPWKPLMSGMIQVPLPPDLTLSIQYTDRIRQDPLAVKTPLQQHDFSTNPSIAWTSMSFPWSCKLFGWLNGDKANAKEKAADQFKYCVGAELDLGMWYLPLDLTSKGTQRVEGYGDVSFLVPLASLSFFKGVAPHLTKDDSAKSRIRIKYSDSVNVANGYVRTRAWTYGIELVK